MGLIWRNEKPKAAGMYLRSNPPAHAIVKQYVVDPQLVNLTDTRGLCLVGWEGNLIPYDRIPDRFWWFGPIPEPPRKTEGT